jgi:hypothetical protein
MMQKCFQNFVSASAYFCFGKYIFDAVTSELQTGDRPSKLENLADLFDSCFEEYFRWYRWGSDGRGCGR